MTYAVSPNRYFSKKYVTRINTLDPTFSIQKISEFEEVAKWHHKKNQSDKFKTQDTQLIWD